MKKFLFLFFALIFFSCGKKLPPPSPDIFPPKLLSAHYSENEQVKFDFSERIDKTTDSVFAAVTADSPFSLKGYSEGSSYFLYYTDTLPLKYVSLFGIRDIEENKKDFINIKIAGEPLKDTVPPKIVKNVKTDSTMIFEFTEDVFVGEIIILPSYVSFYDTIIKNKIIIKFTDTLGFYPIDVAFVSLKDKKENVFPAPVYFRFTDQSESLYGFSLKIKNVSPNKKFDVLSSDSIKIMTRFSLSDSQVLFEKLSSGRYFVSGEGFCLDTLLMSE